MWLTPAESLPSKAGGDISLLTKADGDQVQINVARTTEATRNSNFRSLVHEIAVTYRGHQCLQAPDMAALGFAAGDQVTLQLAYLAGTANTKLYQCADVTLVATEAFVPAPGAMSRCVNGAYDYATPDARNYADEGNGGLTAGQKGGIGAGVSVGALLLIGLGAYLYKRKRSSAKVVNSRASIDGRTLQGDDSSVSRVCLVPEPRHRRVLSPGPSLMLS